MSAPNPDDPLDTTVAELWKTNEMEAMKRAREFTRSFAMKDGGDGGGKAAGGGADDDDIMVIE